jgi:hypothetical protein
MSVETLVRLMNYKDKSVGIIAPYYYPLLDSLREFAIMASRVSLRVLILVNDEGQVKESLDSLHTIVTGRVNTSKVVYNLTTGGTIKCITYSKYLEMEEIDIPDVLLLCLDEITMQMALDISYFKFNKKMVIITSKSEEYLGAFVSKFYKFH